MGRLDEIKKEQVPVPIVVSKIPTIARIWVNTLFEVDYSKGSAKIINVYSSHEKDSEIKKDTKARNKPYKPKINISIYIKCCYRISVSFLFRRILECYFSYRNLKDV